MDDIDFSNENYLKEMERNTRLFEEKMNKLEAMRSKNFSSIEPKKLAKKQFKSCNKFTQKSSNSIKASDNNIIIKEPNNSNNISNKIKSVKINDKNNNNINKFNYNNNIEDDNNYNNNNNNNNENEYNNYNNESNNNSNNNTINRQNKSSITKKNEINR